MKYTDGLFEFPVRIYDGTSLRRAQKREEDMEVTMDGEWVMGTAEIPFNDVKGLIDFFSKGRTIDEVREEGFDCCIVMTHNYGDFICTLPKKRFKERLNAFAEKYANIVESMVKKELEIKQLNSPPPRKRWRFWR